jgi:GNAT superfamily N-acetyltransferase
MPQNRFRYLDFDVSKPEQQDVVLRLCKTNEYSYGDVWLHLRRTPPPGMTDVLTASIQSRIEEFSKTADEWTVKGMIAVDGSVTENNPEGTSKVVGFMMYQIHKASSAELEILFTLVDKCYRKRGHATNMMKALELLHLNPQHKNKANELVNFFTARVEAQDTAVEFYKKLGFTAHRIPINHFYTTMFKGGPKYTTLPEILIDTQTHVSGEQEGL